MKEIEKQELASIRGGARRRAKRAGCAFNRARFVD